MKLSGARIESFLKAPDATARAILVYGPDAGLVKERLDRLSKLAVSNLSDPFRVAELAAGQLKDDPARLADEAAALSLTGGRRVVRVRDAGDNATSVLQSFLANPMGEAMVLIEGGDLGPRSSLRKLFEGADNAAALPCYADEGATLESVINETFREAKLTADADAVAYLVDNLGGDRRLTRAELSKLVLYVGNGGRVTLDDAMACVGDTAAMSMDDLSMAVAEGDQATVQRVLTRLLMEGTNAVTILRSMMRHFQRLHLAAGVLAQKGSIDVAMAALKPPPIFKVANRVRAQVQRWPTDRLATALDLLTGAEMDCKTTGLPSDAICGRVLLQITRAAGKPSPRGRR